MITKEQELILLLCICFVQAVMMDALICGFIEDLKKKSVQQPADEPDRPPVYDTATDSDGKILSSMILITKYNTLFKCKTHFILTLPNIPYIL